MTPRRNVIPKRTRSVAVEALADGDPHAGIDEPDSVL